MTRKVQLNHSETVAAGSTSIFYLDKVHIDPPITVTALPGVGGTATVETTTSLVAAVVAGTATWIVWPNGTAGAVASDTTDVIVGPITALRFTATTQPADFEVAT